jgi:hypothetical protein
MQPKVLKCMAILVFHYDLVVFRVLEIVFKLFGLALF